MYISDICDQYHACHYFDDHIVPSRLFFIVEFRDYDKRWYGTDGFGDIFHTQPNNTALQSEHAVSAINRICQENKGQVTLIALGPLTNIALAYK